VARRSPASTRCDRIAELAQNLALLLEDATDAGDGGALPALLRRPRPGRSIGDPLPSEQRNASRERDADE
jgi:hypothetical protein